MRSWQSACTVLMRSFAVLAAVAVGGRAVAEVVPMALAPTGAQLVFVEGRDSVRLLGDQRLTLVDPASAGERQLQAYCSNGETQRGAAEKGFVNDIISTIYSLVIDRVAERVKAELAKYSAMSERTARVDYYRGSNGGARLDHRYTCLRFTRIESTAGGGTAIALDLVAGIGLDSGRDAILLRPLRLFAGNAAAKSATGRYGIAILVRAEAVWRDAVVGQKGVIFDQTIASENVELPSKPFLKYYPTDPLVGQRVPIIPVSVDADRTHDFGRADFTVTAAEIGAQPATLAFLAQLLPTTTDRRTQLLMEAARIANLPTP
jgi:hypothetical protein